MNEDAIIIPAPRSFTPAEAALAWLSIVCGYLFCRAFPIWLGPLGFFVMLIVLYVSSTWLALKQGLRPDAFAIAVGASGIAVSAALIVSCGDLLLFFASAWGLVSWLYYVRALRGPGIKKGFSDLILLDFFKALILPFSSMGSLFPALATARTLKGGRFLLKLLIGIALALVPTAVVLALLSYDSLFTGLLKDIFNIEGTQLLSHGVSILFGIPVGMYLFGAHISAADGKGADFITREGCEKTAEKVKIAPAVTVLAAALPVLFLYVVFFISQWSYYLSGFTGLLPDGFSYADYAREGFFQLCTVAVINLLLLSALSLFMKRSKTAQRILYKLLAIIFVVSTLVLMATAMAKLIMYIRIYGLTPKRVYAAWFMAVLALVFILVAVKQFVSRLNTVAWAMAIFVVMFAALSLSNPGAIIARYNVDRYEAGTLESVDIEAMEELGLAAVPELVRLKTMLEEEGDIGSGLYTDCVISLRYLKNSRLGSDCGIFDMNLPWILARKALGDVYLPNFVQY